MKLLLQLICLFLSIKGLVKTKETSKAIAKPVPDHEDSSSGNDVIIKISEKKKATSEEKALSKKQKKQAEKPKPMPVPDSTYQVPTSNILFKDLETKKVEIPEKDYKELVANTRMMNNAIGGLQKMVASNNTIIRKIQDLNPDKENSKARDLFNIKVIEVSDDAKSTTK